MKTTAESDETLMQPFSETGNKKTELLSRTQTSFEEDLGHNTQHHGRRSSLMSSDVRDKR
jgi:hypothetical protein